MFDAGLQQERTALAWERTAIASMVSGVLFARYSALELHVAVAAIGILQVVLGAVLLSLGRNRRPHLLGPLPLMLLAPLSMVLVLLSLGQLGWVTAAWTCSSARSTSA